MAKASEDAEQERQVAYEKIDKKEEKAQANWEKHLKKLNDESKSEQNDIDKETELYNQARGELEQSTHHRQMQITALNIQLNPQQSSSKAINSEIISSIPVAQEHKQDNESNNFICWGLAACVSGGLLFLMICAIHSVYAVLILKAFCSAKTIETIGVTTATGFKVGGIGLSAMTFFGGAIDLIRYQKKNNLSRPINSHFTLTN